MLNGQGRRLWHDTTEKVERKRYFEPITATTALAALAAAGGTAGVGYGIGNMFGLFGGKKKQQEDPLAGIRQQLVDLSSGVPNLVARQKEQIASLFKDYQKTGMENIQENVHAERGLGRSSIESRLNTELMDKLFKGQTAAELEADKWGVNMQGALLGKAGGFAQPVQEEDDIWSGLFEAGLGLGGQELGYQISKLLKPSATDEDSGIPSFAQNLFERPGEVYSSGDDLQDLYNLTRS